MKNEIKIIITLIVFLIGSVSFNVYFLGRSSSHSDTIELYDKLSEQSDTTARLLTEGIERAKEDLAESRRISDELRETIGTLQATNERREQLNSIASSISGRIRVEISEGIAGIDRSETELSGLQESEQAERQSLEGILGGDSD